MIGREVVYLDRRSRNCYIAGCQERGKICDTGGSHEHVEMTEVGATLLGFGQDSRSGGRNGYYTYPVAILAADGRIFSCELHEIRIPEEGK